MSTVPGKQEVHFVDGCYRKVKGILFCSSRENSIIYDGSRQCEYLGCEIKQGDIFECQQPSLRCFGGPGTCFLNHELGDEHLEISAFEVPPLLGNLLVSSQNEISAGARGEIAYHRCLKIQFQHHPLIPTYRLNGVVPQLRNKVRTVYYYVDTA